MKHLLFLTLISILALSACNDATTDPYQTDKIVKTNLIGAVTFSMEHTDITGTLLGTYYQTEHIPGIKVELIEEDDTVDITYTIDTDSLDCFYLLENLKMGVSYKLKASLNDKVYDISSPFIITDSDVKELNREAFIEQLGSAPDWFKTGNYYQSSINNACFNFDFLSNDTDLSLKPQPIVDSGQILFAINKPANCKLSVLTNNMELVKNIYTGMLTPQTHNFLLDAQDLEHGFYFLKLKIVEDSQEKEYFYPFSVLKYRDDFITTPYKN